MTALPGPSGRGKSTLLYVLGRMLTPSLGHVELEGVNVSALADRDRSWVRATRIGFVFQDSALDPTMPMIESVMEPALYAGWRSRVARTSALVLLERLGLADRAHHRPGEISGGQAQRAAVCRALVTDPAVVLADEPTGNLDRDNAQVVLDALAASARLGGGRSVVVATHDPYVIDFADEVLRL